jgi:hypothetical protein
LSQSFEILGITKVFNALFDKVVFKEDKAKKVLSPEVLAKFKTVKELLLKGILLSQNLLTLPEGIELFKAFADQTLKSSSIDITLKTRLIYPSSLSEFRKLKFTNYFGTLNKEDIHTLLFDFVVMGIINNPESIQHNW